MNPLYDLIAYPSTTPQRGKTMMILGLSKDGPVNTPIPVTTPEKAAEIFGTEGSLYKSYSESFNTDNSVTVYLMRVTGEHATAMMYGSQDFKTYEAIKFKSIYGGEHYNQMQAVIKYDETDGFMLVFSFPPGSRFETISYPLDNYETTGMLVRAINEDTRAGLSCVYATATRPDDDSKTIVGINDAVSFSGGEDGLNITKNDLFLALDYSYELLLGFYIDVIIAPDARFDDVTPLAFYGDAVYGGSFYSATRDYLSLKDTQLGDRVVTFHGQLINFCKAQMKFGIMTHGVIGLNPVEDIENLEEFEFSYLVELVEATAFRKRYDLAVFNNGSWADSGYYISVVAGEMFFNDGTDEEYYDNWAVKYATMIAALGPGTTTNLPVPGENRLRYHFTNAEIAEMGYLGVVVPRESVRKGVVVANGVTASIPDSDLHSIANVRQIQYALGTVNDVLDVYNGEPMAPILQNKSIDKAVEKALSELKNQGIIVDYQFNIEYDRYRGSAVVNMDLLAKQMVDSISASATLSFSE